MSGGNRFYYLLQVLRKLILYHINRYFTRTSPGIFISSFFLMVLIMLYF